MIQSKWRGCHQTVAITLLFLLFSQAGIAGQSRVGLKLVVSEGEAAISVRVTDRDNSPIPRASVVFTAPEGEVNGVFTNGLNTVTVTTDDSGLAVARFSGPDNGKRQIDIRAQFSGETATATIRQGVAPGKSFSRKLLLLAAAGAVAGTAVALGNKGGGSPATDIPGPSGGAGPSTQPGGAVPTITFGGASVGAPR